MNPTLQNPGEVPSGVTIPLGKSRTVPGTQQASSASVTGMPTTQQSPNVSPTQVPQGNTTQYTGASTQQTMAGNPLDFQDAIYQMDRKARGVQDLQDQKNALLGVLYQSNVSPEVMAKLTPEQALAIKSGRRETIDSAVRSINNQIEGRYTEANSALEYINGLADKTKDSSKELLGLLKDPEGQKFLKDNLTEEGRNMLSKLGISVDKPSSGMNLAQRNNNPGNIRDVVTGQFRVFNSVEEGKKAWLDDFTVKATGRSRTGIKPESTLAEYIAVYAPKEDNNDVGSYIKSVVQKTGFSETATLADILAAGRANELGEAMFTHEGFYNKTSGGTGTGVSELEQNYDELMKDESTAGFVYRLIGGASQSSIPQGIREKIVGLAEVYYNRKVESSDSTLRSQKSFGYLPSQDKTRALTTDDVIVSLQDYKKVYDEETKSRIFGSKITGTGAARINSAYNDLIFKYAQAVGTGALQAADKEVIEDIIPNGAALSGVRLFRGGKEGVLATLDDRIKSNTQKLSAYGLMPSTSKDKATVEKPASTTSGTASGMGWKVVN